MFFFPDGGELGAESDFDSSFLREEGSGLRDFERPWPGTLRSERKRPQRCFFPGSSASTSEESEAADKEELGRSVVSLICASRALLAWLRGMFETMPSNERKGPFPGESGAS